MNKLKNRYKKLWRENPACLICYAIDAVILIVYLVLFLSTDVSWDHWLLLPSIAASAVAMITCIIHKNLNETFIGVFGIIVISNLFINQILPLNSTRNMVFGIAFLAALAISYYTTPDYDEA